MAVLWRAIYIFARALPKDPIMKFAVASDDLKTVCGRAGHAVRFILFDAQKGEEPKALAQIELSDEETFHNFKGGSHPLDGIDVLIAESAGACFVERMQQRGIVTVVATGLAPDTAVVAYLMGVIGPLTEPSACSCGHEHDHHH